MSVTIEEKTAQVLEAIQKGIGRSLLKCGIAAEGYAKDKCPVDTGNLQNSITHAEDDTSMLLGTNVNYAVYVEMGTIKMLAQPYLRPAITEHTKVYQDIFLNEFKNIK